MVQSRLSRPSCASCDITCRCPRCTPSKDPIVATHGLIVVSLPFIIMSAYLSFSLCVLLFFFANRVQSYNFISKHHAAAHHNLCEPVAIGLVAARRRAASQRAGAWAALLSPFMVLPVFCPLLCRGAFCLNPLCLCSGGKLEVNLR